MLTFFRRIRKGLLSSGQARGYMFYGIGEIALVVIGILIALQINNWNEDRKNLALEMELMTELLEDLRLDTVYLNYQIERVENISSSIEYLLTEPDSFNSPERDMWTFASIYFVPNEKAMESINSIGVQIPRDDDLRNLIREHYHDAKFLLDLISLGDQDFLEFWSIPLQKSQFHYVLNQGDSVHQFDYDIIPNDYNKTKESKEFKDFLIKKKIRIKEWNLFLNRIRDSTVSCTKAIEEFLSS